VSSAGLSPQPAAPELPRDAAGIAAFIEDFESRRLPKSRWSHQAHLLVGLWYLSRHEPDAALAIVRERIRAHNEAVGTPNTDSSGYHETITRLYLAGIAAHRARTAGSGLEECLRELLASPLADSGWPLEYYSRRRLFSVDARRQWVEPDRPSPDRRAVDLASFRDL
jgi:hypothetical protein